MTSIRNNLIEQCKVLNIIFPERASKKQIKALIDDYYKTAAVVTTDHGLCLRQTNKPTAEYCIEFTISASICVRAESEESAREWVEGENLPDDSPYPFEYVDSGSPEIIDCYKLNDEDCSSPFSA